jgi:Fic family protein
MEPFIPQDLPLKNLNWGDFVAEISLANREIARYDGLLQSVPEPLVLLAPLRTKEAVLSSKIEGTQATLEEVFEYEAEQGFENNRMGDIFEVLNYREALAFAVEEMESRPISTGLIKRIHAILLQGVRGETRDPGNFRRIQNWIGKPGSAIEDARFIPPSPALISESLSNWEKYIHYEDIDPLVQLAIVHAQFEIIHPFLDGNGRIGRIIIPLFLYHHKIIHQPAFYLSAYFESNRDEYYDSLKSITDTGDWSKWIKFFLKALISQSKENTSKVKSILFLYEDMKEKITEYTHSQFAIQALDQIFCSPVFNSTKFIRETKIPRASAMRILSTLSEKGILRIVRKGTGRSPSLYRFKKLMDVINN